MTEEKEFSPSISMVRNSSVAQWSALLLIIEISLESIMKWWVWSGGCGVVGVEWWVWSGGCGVVGVDELEHQQRVGYRQLPP